MSLNKVIISGGGTGGHIFPAIAIANAIKNVHPSADILFVGALGKMEMQKVPLAGYKIVGLNITGLQRKFTFSNLMLPFRLFSSFYKANKIINDFKPDAVIGVGGYASAAVLFVAGLKNIPVLIQEQNSFPGKTNQFLSRFAKKICVAYPGMQRFLPANKIVITGNPVRQEIEYTIPSRQDAIQFFGLDSHKKTVFVFGGSQGAASINEGVERALAQFASNNIQVIWQTGESFVDRAIRIVNENQYKNILVFPFIEKMNMAYAAADLVVSRAGAMTIAEICILGKPSILVPFPFAAEDHQTKNAMALVEKNAAQLIKNEAAPVSIGASVLLLINDHNLCNSLSNNAKNMAHYKAAQQIVSQIESIVQ